MVVTAELFFTTGLRGFHVHSNTVGWKPYLHQKVTFKREVDNVHDRFAVAGLVTLPRTLAPVIVGHVPSEFSRYVWYALGKGAKFTGEVISQKTKRSPLLQGGPEVPITVTVKWNDPRCLAILKAKTEKVFYPIDTDYRDDSKSILDEILKEACDFQDYFSAESDQEADLTAEEVEIL